MKLARDNSSLPVTAIPVAIYTRVSTAGQVGGRFDSCANQEAVCRDYIASRAAEGWFEIACYTDAAYSGADMNRPGIRAMKRQIASGDIKVLLIYKLERLLRCVDEWTPFRIFLRQHGCRLISTTEDICEATPEGRLRNNILVSVSEYERLNTGVKVRAKMLEQAKRGYWNYGAVPFGYDYDSSTQVLSPNPAEAPIVRGIFEDAANGVSVNKIADRLAAAGHRTRVREWISPERERRTVGGGTFRAQAIRGIIRNGIYAGRIRFSDQYFPGLHQALVSAELWEKANLAEEKAKPVKRLHHSPSVHENPVSNDPTLEQSESKSDRRYYHAIHRALAWQLLRSKQPKQTTAEFANSVGMSVASVDFHFRLLKLAPEIQAFLLKLTDRASIRRFGLAQMQRLLRLAADAQRVQFERMRASTEQ